MGLLMQKIYKYSITVTGNTRIPANARILHVGMQSNRPHIWAMVDPDAPTVFRKISIIGTGWDLPDDNGEFLGTVFGDHGYVWHIFDRGVAE